MVRLIIGRAQFDGVRRTSGNKCREQCWKKNFAHLCRAACCGLTLIYPDARDLKTFILPQSGRLSISLQYRHAFWLPIADKLGPECKAYKNRTSRSSC